MLFFFDKREREGGGGGGGGDGCVGGPGRSKRKRVDPNGSIIQSAASYKVQHHTKCISGTDLLRPLYVLSH